MRGALAIIPVLIVLALGACGPTPPQAPLAQARMLDEATGGISTTCGLSYELSAFPGPREPDLAVLEATAATAAAKLAAVYARDAAWIYQGETVGAIVRDSLTMLRQCGLSRAASELTRRTGVRG